MKRFYPTLLLLSLLLMEGYNDTPVVEEESAGTQQAFTLSASMPGSSGLCALWDRTGLSFTGEADVQAYKITMTTSKKITDKIRLLIDAAEEDQSDVWIDLNNNGTKDDGEGVTEFEDYNNYTIVSQTVTLYGKVTELNCSSNKLTALDVSKNTALTHLDCSGNSLTALDVSNNTELIYLDCSSISLTALDVSNNTELIYLYCSGNSLDSLNVSKNTALTYLSCSSNDLTALDVSNNTALTELYCFANFLTALDVSGATALNYLFCSSNSLDSLDVSNNTALTGLYCYRNGLTALDVTNNTALTGLSCSVNSLTALDVSQNTALTSLWCSNNKINGEEMDKLVGNLPDRSGLDVQGEIYVIDLYSTPLIEENVCTTTQVDTATGKNWKVMESWGDLYGGSEE